MTTFSAIQLNIPNPVLQKVPVDNSDKSPMRKTWEYFTIPTVFMYAEDWMVLLPNGMKIMIAK